MGKIVFFLLIPLFCLNLGCHDEAGSIESISLDFPQGETRLLVSRNGEARLFYGALPQHRKIKQGTFAIDELYRQLGTRLHANVPREEWPDPKSTCGMVQIRFKDKSQKSYLIFDEEEFAEGLFRKARQNIVSHIP